MENKAYQGESLGMVFRCRDANGQDSNLSGARVDVALIDELDVIRKEWSTSDGSLQVKGNIVAGGFSKTETVNFKGIYRMEVKITIEGAVMMDTVSGIRIWGTLTGR